MSEQTTQFLQALQNQDFKQISAFLSPQIMFTDHLGESLRDSDSAAGALVNLFSSVPNATWQTATIDEHQEKVWISGKFVSNGVFASALFCLEYSNQLISTIQVFGDFSKLRMRTSQSQIEGDLSVQAFGGVFLKSPDPKALAAWYDGHLGTKFGDNPYQPFMWRNSDYPDLTGRTEFALFKEDNNYFSPSSQKVMLNFRVNNLNKLIEKLRKDGVQLEGEPETFDYGKFAWLIDPDGRKIELWEPVDEVLDNYDDQKNQ